MSFGYSQRGGWYGGPLFWLFFGCVFLGVMIIVAWIVAILLAVFLIGLGIWAVFEYRRQKREMSPWARAHLAPPSTEEIERDHEMVALVERKLREREASGTVVQATGASPIQE